jgi:hypothetical protein
MAIAITGDQLHLKNQAAGCVWALYLILFAALTCTVLALWFTGDAAVPAWARWLFTVGLIAAAPLLLRQARGEEIVDLRFDRAIGEIAISRRVLFRTWSERRTIANITNIDWEESDHDGYYYRVLLVFRDGARVPIITGTVENAVRDDMDRLRDFLADGSGKLLIEAFRS